jgi:hypothetical protein
VLAEAKGCRPRLPISILAFSQAKRVAVARAEGAPTLLASVKAATGGDAWNNIRSLHSRGKEIVGEMTRSREAWDDVRTGRYVVHAQSLFGTQGAGFDGVSPLIQIYGGQSYTFGDEEAQLGATNAAYQVSLAYRCPERRAATMQHDGIKQEEGRTFEVVTITPAGGRPFSLWVDRATHLVDRVVEQEDEKISVTRCSDYREVNSVKFPFTKRRVRLDSNDWDVETVESVAVNPSLSDDEFALPAIPAPKFDVEHGKSSTTVPFILGFRVRQKSPIRIHATPMPGFARVGFRGCAHTYPEAHYHFSDPHCPLTMYDSHAYHCAFV